MKPVSVAPSIPKWIILSVAMACLAAPGPEPVAQTERLNVLEIVGKPIHEVEDLLGIARNCKKSYLGEACRFEDGRIEIEFVNGEADWITVEFQDVDVAFDYQAITWIGLLPVQAAVHNPFVMAWLGHHGLQEVIVRSRGKYVSLIQVRANTPG